MNTILKNRFTLYISISFTVLVMVFGIGQILLTVNTVSAATPAVESTELQPAGDSEAYAALEGAGAEEDKATESESAAEDDHAEEVDPGVVGMFGINWKLFLAQLVNFGIVVFVLWRWVFKPVTSGLSARTEKIENSLKEAEKIAEDRLTFDSWKQGEISAVRTEASAIITEAKKQAEALKAESVKATAEEQARVIEQAQKRLEQEKASMLDSAKAELADIVVQATSTILKEKIDPKKDKELIDKALKSAQN